MCWGGNQYGQLGIGSHQAELSPVILSNLQGVVINNLSAGAAHVCALSDAGGVWCWGANGGALGDGTELERTLPVAAIGMDSHVTALASGYAHSCALKDDGAVWCWGNNSIGQLGDGSLMNRLQPVAVAGLGIAAVSITAGYGHTCALLSDGAIRCWGLNESGQLGDGSVQSSVNPVAVSGVGGSATRVAAGYAHTCATLSSGGVRCWGSNAHAQLGDGTLTDRTTPIGVQGMNAGVTSLAAGGLHTCATRSDGRVWCWGSNQWGQTGDGSAGYQSFPTSAVRSARLFADGFE
jgi:alpha-tubulin suppressor-like RCC1 family protein